MEEDRAQLVRELKQTAAKLLFAEREIYSVFELTGTVGKRKRKYGSSNYSDNSGDLAAISSETKVGVKIVPAEISVDDSKIAENSFNAEAAHKETVAVVAEYQEIKDDLESIGSYQLLIKLKLKISKMIELHWKPAWKTRMVEIVRGIRLDVLVNTASTGNPVSALQYKVTIPLVPVIIGDKVVQGRECSVTFGSHRNHKMPCWSFPTLQPVDRPDRSVPLPEDLDPLYVTKNILGFVKLEMPTNLWYQILRGIEEEFQTVALPLSNIVENQDIRDYREFRERRAQNKHGLENQIYVHPQHYNKELYAQDSRDSLLSKLQPGQWNTIDVLRSEFRIVTEPRRSLCTTYSGALLTAHSKQAAKIAVNGQITRMIDLLFRDSTKSTGTAAGSILDWSAKCACAKAVGELLQIRKTSRKNAYQLAFVGNDIELLWPQVSRYEIAFVARHTLPENRYLIEWSTDDKVPAASGISCGTSAAIPAARLFLDGVIPPITLSVLPNAAPITTLEMKSNPCDQVLVGDFFRVKSSRD